MNWFTQRVKTARPRPGLAVKCPVRAGWAISHILLINRQSSQLVRLPVPAFKAALYQWAWLDFYMCIGWPTPVPRAAWSTKAELGAQNLQAVVS